MDEPKMNYPAKINDPRLTPDMNRVRNGATQGFSKPENRNPHIDGYDVELQPPESHIYAELINGEWCWVNGCAECNGQPRDWMTYIECDKHNVCAHCGCSRASLSEPPWGRKHGWVCKPCADKEHEAEKAEALAAMPDEYDEWDYSSLSNVTCPYCRLELEGDHDLYEADGEKVKCPRCDNTFTVSAEPVIYFTTKRVEAE